MTLIIFYIKPEHCILEKLDSLSYCSITSSVKENYKDLHSHDKFHNIH